MRKQHSIVALVTPWTVAVAAFCVADPDLATMAFSQVVSGLAAPAAALGLTLFTAANQNRR